MAQNPIISRGRPAAKGNAIQHPYDSTARTIYWVSITMPHSKNYNIKGNLTCSFSSSSLLSLRSSSSILKEGTQRYRYLANSRDFSTEIPVLEQRFSNECSFCCRSVAKLSPTLCSPMDWRWNQSTLKEINPEYSLEGLILKLKFQYSGHLMRRANSLEKSCC